MLSPKFVPVPSAVVSLDHTSTPVLAMVNTSAVVFVHRLLSKIYNQDVPLFFGILAACVIRRPLSCP